MTFLDVRNIIIKRLSEHLGIPVVLSGQVSPVPDFPFGYYSVVTPYAPTGQQGAYSASAGDGGTSIATVRAEQPYATFSFTFCSINRDDGEGGYIFGEDEAQGYAEQAQGFFLHGAYMELSNLGIVTAEVSNAADRTTLAVDEAASRCGFDVRVRYTRTDCRSDPTVDSVGVHMKKE